MMTAPTRTRIFIRTRFEGFHLWESAPGEVAFLRVLHRHVFHVQLDMVVTHDDRDREFILLKREVDAHLAVQARAPEVRTWSCEAWARHLLERFPPATRVEVSEDGENGAFVELA